MNIKKTTSIWQAPNGYIVRVLYNSPISWEKTLLADIDLNNEEISLFPGNEENNKQLIARFNIENGGNDCKYRELSYTGNDLTIINEARKVIEKSGAPYRLLKIHVDAVLKYSYLLTDASCSGLDEIQKQMNDICISEANGKKGAFFCGTTDDLDIKIERHRMHDFEIADERVFAWECANVQTASSLKQWASEEGYDIKENVLPKSDEDPKRAAIVYLLKKGKAITENRIHS